jgi:CYTH domain-containing protein
MSTEIERKWIVVTEIPGEILDDHEPTQIKQAYLAVQPQREVRVRRTDEKSTLCVKTGKGKTREEHSVEIGREAAEKMFEAAVGVVGKSRFEISREDYTIELDVYSGKLSGLVVAEIEDPPKNLEVPGWFGHEVTEDPRFKNKNLATNNGTWPCL